MICIIPARGGSQRIPNKNIKLFHNKPIIAYSIHTALDSELFEQVYVSTDSAEIRDVALKCGALYLDRTLGYEEDDVGTQTVMANELRKFPSNWDHYACCLYATAPMITTEDLHKGFMYLTSCGAPYAISVDSQNEDVGGFYFGFRYAFLTGVPLNKKTRVGIRVDDIDINTLDDWTRAEDKYEELYYGTD